MSMDRQRRQKLLEQAAERMRQAGTPGSDATKTPPARPTRRVNPALRGKPSPARQALVEQMAKQQGALRRRRMPFSRKG
jgi:hypothetical protein